MKSFLFPKLLLVAIYVLAFITWIGFFQAHAGDCTFPNLNKCLQQEMPMCPKAMFPDLRTPGLTDQMLRPDDVAAIRCRMFVVSKCNVLTMALDNNACIGPDAISDDPATDPTTPTPALPTPSAGPTPSPTPASAPKTHALDHWVVPVADNDDENNCPKSEKYYYPDETDFAVYRKLVR